MRGRRDIIVIWGAPGGSARLAEALARTLEASPPEAIVIEAPPRVCIAPMAREARPRRARDWEQRERPAKRFKKGRGG